VAEVDRLRDERLNDLLQAEADPRRRADEVFAATIYSGGSPYRRPSGGLKPTVEQLDAARLRTAYQRGSAGFAVLTLRRSDWRWSLPRS
jgi:predicted Zn-dependent peptidase